MSIPDDLFAPLTREWSHIAPLVRDVHWVAQTASTMDLVQAMAGTAREGLLVVADEQTAGRGRRGRTWASPPGAGLYFSVLLLPPAPHKATPARLPRWGPRQGVPSVRGSTEGTPVPPSLEGTALAVPPGTPERSGLQVASGGAAVPSVLGLLTLAAGVGVTEGVAAATGLRTQLKWPNDVLVDRRKLAGILAEGIAVSTAAQAVVLGVGVNVSASAYPADVAARATSLETELGRIVDRGEVLAQILVAMARWYRALLEARYDEVLRAWRAAAPSATGTTVEWTTPEGVQRGVTAGIDSSGALLVRTPAGVARLIAGEVNWT